MTRTVSGSASTLHRLFAKVGSMPTERALIDCAIWVTVERHTEVLELVHGIGGFATHEFDRVLVT